MTLQLIIIIIKLIYVLLMINVKRLMKLMSQNVILNIATPIISKVNIEGEGWFNNRRYELLKPPP